MKTDSEAAWSCTMQALQQMAGEEMGASAALLVSPLPPCFALALVCRPAREAASHVCVA
jgi:hypothetical protein